MARRTREKKIWFIDLLTNQKWITSLEKRFEKQLKSARDTFDKNFEKAKKSLNITTKRDLNAIHSKIKALEKRIERIEGIIKVKPPRPKSPNGKEAV